MTTVTEPNLVVSGTLTAGTFAPDTIAVVNGTAGEPSIAFSEHTASDTGIYSGGDNVVGISTNGIERVKVEDTGVTITGTLEVSGVGAFAPGDALAPGVTFTSASTDGIFREEPNIIGIATGGTKRLEISSAGTSITGSLSVSDTSAFASGSAAGPGIAFSDDQTAGLYENLGGVGIATGGVSRLLVTDATTTIANALDVEGALDVTGVADFAAGAVDGVAISFDGNTNTGLYSTTAGNMEFASQGALVSTFSTTGLTLESGKKITIPDIPGSGTDAVNKTYADGYLLGIDMTPIPPHSVLAIGGSGSISVQLSSGTPNDTSRRQHLQWGGVDATSITWRERAFCQCGSTTLQLQDNTSQASEEFSFSALHGTRSVENYEWTSTGQITSETITVTNGGSGYANGTGGAGTFQVTLTGGSFTEAASAIVVVETGVVVDVIILKGGVGYVQNDSLSASNADLGETGSGLVITVDSVVSASALPAMVFNTLSQDATASHFSLMNPPNHHDTETAGIKIENALSGARLKFEINATVEIGGTTSAESCMHAVLFFYDNTASSYTAVAARQSYQFHRTDGTGTSTHSLAFVEELDGNIGENDYWIFKVFMTKSSTGSNLSLSSIPYATNILITEL